MDPASIARSVVTLLTAVLTALALSWVARAAARRRHLAGGAPGHRRLGYPRWTVGLGVACAALGCVCAWFAAHAPPARGGPAVALVFVGFALLGVMVAVSALADTFVVDPVGLERSRFGWRRRVEWSALARVSAPLGGPGIRLASKSGVRLEVPALVDGFGALCDELLLRSPDGFRVEAAASRFVLEGATLPPEPLQRAYARFFEAEEAEPPPGWPPADLAVAAGRAFAARLLVVRGSFLPFEARWTPTGAVRITHGAPRGDDPGWASLRLDGEEVVITTDEGTFRERVDDGPGG